MNNTDLILDVNENPKKKSQWFLFAIQHVLAMLVACITVPIITGLPIGPTLVAAGVGTLIYIFTTKRKSPVFLSSSFAYLSPMSTALALGTVSQADHRQNLAALMVGMILVGAVYIIIALVIKKLGTGWLNKLLPPVVIGPVIMVIGLCLASSAINNVNTGTAAIQEIIIQNDALAKMKVDTMPIPWDLTIMSIVVAFVACIVTAVCATCKKKTLSLIPFVIGMVGAYVFAAILTGIGNGCNVECLKIIDFSIFTKANWGDIKTWFTTDFLFVNIFKQELPFTWEIFGQVVLLFVPVSLVTVCEHIGDHENLGNIINKDLLNEEPGLTRTLIGDGLATAVSGVFCGAANTTYGENVAVVGVSKIASVSVIILAAFMSIVIGMFGPLNMLLKTVPNCITGGISLILYGFIAASGVKLLVKEKIDFGITRNIVIASVILVIGIGGLALCFGGNSFGYTVTITSTAVAMIAGILFNLFLPKEKAEIVNNEVPNETK